MTNKWLMGTALAAIMSTGAFAQDAAQECRFDVAMDQGMDAQQRFQEIDANADGRISREEYLNCLSTKNIELSDADRDAFMASFDELDSDADTYLVIAEIGAPATGSTAAADASAATTETAATTAATPTQVQVEQQQAAVTVKQDEPTVRVQQEQPTVKVEQPEPTVRVDQKQPDVRVTQPKPEVKVTQPKPEVVIDQPKPEIQVEQPKAEVAIEQPEPEVKVTQAEPKVRVEVREPKVSVEQPEAKVAVTKAEPTVKIEQAKPKIVVEQAKPEVVIEKVSDVDATVDKAGMPKTDVDKTASAGTTAAKPMADTAKPETMAAAKPASDAAAKPEMTAAAKPTADTAAPGTAETRVAAAGAEKTVTGDMAATKTFRIARDDYIDDDVYNLAGDEIGQIDDIVLDPRTNRPVVVVSVGGFLGIGDKELVFDIDEFSFNEDKTILNTRLDEAALKERVEYDQARYQELPEDMIEYGRAPRRLRAGVLRPRPFVVIDLNQRRAPRAEADGGCLEWTAHR